MGVSVVESASTGKNGLSDQRNILVYRDRLAPRSEAQFLRRQYVGFSRLHPIWVGCRTDQGLPELGAQPVIVGRRGALGECDRALFKQLGIVPAHPDFALLRPLIIHAQFGRGGALALPIARALRIPLVVTFHGGDATKDKHYGNLPTVFRRRLSALKREASLFVCASDFIRDRLVARGFPASKLRVIRLGVDVQSPAETVLPARPPYILFVGRLVEKKGCKYLIEAARLLAATGSPIKIVVIGDGPRASELRTQAHDLPSVVFTGWLSSDQVRDHMQRATALCVPSITAQDGDADGLPTVILEAMAIGVPVIGTQQAGIAEAIDHGITGLLVQPASTTALADAIRWVVDNPERRNAMGAAAHGVVCASFDARTQSRRLEDTLLEIIGQRGATMDQRHEAPVHGSD
jgi:glycosyltransferase involved in cell wall biosynthesis